MTSLCRVARLSLAVLAVLAAPAAAGPDFVTDDRAASQGASDAQRPLPPIDDVMFAPGDAALDPSALHQLAAVVHWLDINPGYRLVVEGHADGAGTADQRGALATRRAELVKNHLAGSGVDPDRVIVAVHTDSRARRRPTQLDRRVVVFASSAPVPQLVSSELDHDALEVVWTHLGSRLRETRGITPLATIARRR